ncbi:lysyl oxidase homolog 4 isoform X2 [Microcaecilia unicolor]|uniref:Soluble scavenger receptor cysteine-rich domain-containing protein SSC5D n=1 Tax=Microcaecilia unicolor TaxID=1415580 RepID=A0A6P7XM26_9AMPH|nr:lysyl oxidase homolog 4-like isoform X2 [Microcaecilia unicolor]
MEVASLLKVTLRLLQRRSCHMFDACSVMEALDLLFLLLAFGRSQAEVSFGRSHEKAMVRVRLSDGPHRCAGRVEVYHDGQWDFVCDDNWDINDVAVVCKELGCGEVLAALGLSLYGNGNGTVWLDDVMCNGTEVSLMDCQAQPWGAHNCHPWELAGAVCSDALVKAEVSVTPSHFIFYTGESLTLTCILPALYVHVQVHFLKDQKPMPNGILDVGLEYNTSSLSVTDLHLSNQGNYSCFYTTNAKGQLLTAPRSDPFQIKIGESVFWDLQI